VPRTPAARLPGPPQLLPGRPDAVVDLQTHQGAALVAGEWRYRDAEVRQVDFVGVGPDLGPSGPPNRTYDIVPHAQAADYDDSGWPLLAPPDTRRRLGAGRVCFNWYRINVTIPERVGGFDPTGSTVVFEVVVDDYAEVWVDGALPLSLGRAGGQVVGGFNVPNRVLLGREVRPGQRFQLAVFGINGPLSASPANYIWIRTATLDFYAADRARPAVAAPHRLDRADPAVDAIVPGGAALERVAGGFDTTGGAVWTRDGALLFSSPDGNVIYRWTPAGTVDVVDAKSGYRGTDIGRLPQPGANGLTLDPRGRLTVCQQGNRRVVRVEPHGNLTVLADRYDGRRLNSPNDLVHRSDGTLYFTDPPFGLAGGLDDPGRELPFSGVYRVGDGAVRLLDAGLRAPTGIALSPDERHLYVGDGDPRRKVVVRYRLGDAGDASAGAVLHDMTAAAGEEAVGGLKVDLAGNLYVCGPAGIWLLSAEGRHLGTLRLPEPPRNLAWGGDGRDLYATTATSVYRMRLAIPGVRPT
jgi:gluconolactonase